MFHSPFYQQNSKKTQERSLIREEKSSQSLGSLVNIRDNPAPGSIIRASGSCSSSSNLRNPAQESSQERVSGQSSLSKKVSSDGEIKTAVTVSRSATVAGDIKVLECFIIFSKENTVNSIVRWCYNFVSFHVMHMIFIHCYE